MQLVAAADGMIKACMACLLRQHVFKNPAAGHWQQLGMSEVLLGGHCSAA